jgi:hypothetical protein
LLRCSRMNWLYYRRQSTLTSLLSSRFSRIRATIMWCRSWCKGATWKNRSLIKGCFRKRRSSILFDNYVRPWNTFTSIISYTGTSKVKTSYSRKVYMLATITMSL